ncbi:MAG: hypothetical protein ACK5EW_08365 [Bacteroidota bacterium]|jgi:hypothetical protein
MRATIITAIIFFISLTGYTQAPTKVLNFKGRLFEISLKNNAEKILKTGTVKVFQDKSLYVFIEATHFGVYDFLLPLGHRYTLEFSGENMVSKKIEIDARRCPENLEKTAVDFDVVLFAKAAEIQFNSLNAPIAKYTWDPRIGILLNDDDYSFDQTKALKKEVRKAKKAITLAEK